MAIPDDAEGKQSRSSDQSVTIDDDHATLVKKRCWHFSPIDRVEFSCNRKPTMSLEKIGPYEILGVLGRGGMGTVYRGRHEVGHEIHAIKVLSPTYAHDPHFRGRFESEIKALLKLNHRNIVQLLSFGQEDGMLFFSMELVEGNSLFQMQKKGHKFDWRDIISIARDCTQGLRHAHDRGVIHRDLKPGNLLMAFDDQGKHDHVKLTDFGIAKRFGNDQNTGTNILGTMDFMSPEQAKGEPVTARSDLYSLGTVLFTLLSGRPPFTANSVEESLRNLTKVPAPRICSVKPNVPKQLDELISRLMEKRPEERIPTAQSLLHQIGEIEDSLRTESEAQTAHNIGPSTVESKAFDLSTPRTIENTLEKLKRQESGTEVKSEQSTNDPNATADRTAVEQVSIETPEPTTVNYFNTVTDKLRERQNQPEILQPEQKSGILPIALALIAVIALAVYGVFRAFQPPSADSLFAKIEAKISEPQRALKEIDAFLEHYPEEPRAAELTKLKTIGVAIRNYKSLSNTLTVRARSPQGLSEIENQFMDIVGLAQEQPDIAATKMSAFVTIHSNVELADRDQKCVDAAKDYAIKLQHDLRSDILSKLTRIRNAMRQASKKPDKSAAIDMYRAVERVYRDVNWELIPEGQEGQALLSKSLEEIERLERAIAKEAQEQDDSDPESNAPADKNDESGDNG